MEPPTLDPRPSRLRSDHALDPILFCPTPAAAVVAPTQFDQIYDTT